MNEQRDLEQPCVKKSFWARLGTAVCEKFLAAFCYEIGVSPLETPRFITSTCWYGGWEEAAAHEMMARLRQCDEVQR